MSNYARFGIVEFLRRFPFGNLFQNDPCDYAADCKPYNRQYNKKRDGKT